MSEKTPEGVALELLSKIAGSENKAFNKNPGDEHTTADRKWILDTYAECLQAVQTPNKRRSGG